MQAKDVNRIKKDDRDYSVECAHCGKYFEATRSDASFCSPRCRVAYSREPQKLLNAITHVQGFAYFVQQYAFKYKRNKKVYDALTKLRNAIDIALSQFEND